MIGGGMQAALRDQDGLDNGGDETTVVGKTKCASLRRISSRLSPVTFQVPEWYDYSLAKQQM